MPLGTNILILIGGTLVLGMITLILTLLFKEDDEKYEEPIIVNFMPNYSYPDPGRAIGMEVGVEKIDNRFLLEYQPRDITKLELKGKKEVDNSKIVVDENKIITLPKGTLSKYRTVKLLLAPNAEDYPTELKTTPFGKLLMAWTELVNAVNLEVHMVREGSNRKTDILSRIGDGEISEEFITKTTEIGKELVKMANPDHRAKDARGNFPQSGYPSVYPSGFGGN